MRNDNLENAPVRGHRLTLKFIAGPLLGLILFIALKDALSVSAALTAAVTIWCVVWWVTEPVPIPVTSLLPLSLFPLFGVLDASQVAQSYGSPLILLMLGGFILSRGMESTGTHKRLAIYMVNTCRQVTGGQTDSSVVVGFMLASAVLSMWISNTATVLMLLPIALAILEKSNNPKLPLAMMLGIAYAANVGGMGTPIGTPPNLVFMQIYTEVTGKVMGFVEWMMIGIPVVVVFLPIIAWWLTRRLNAEKNEASEVIQLPAVGQWRVAEKRVLIVFACTAIAWITRGEPFGGWSELLGLQQANDAAVALLGAMALFVVSDGKGGRLLQWEQANSIPWGILLLFAGGICIAKAFSVSGLSVALGGIFSGLVVLPVFIMLLILSLVVSFMTESTSNTATTVLLMPILAAAALSAHLDPQILMIPAALSASCAFMLPVATAPNAIVFGSGKIASIDMLRTGFLLNIVGALIISTLCYLLL